MTQNLQGAGFLALVPGLLLELGVEPAKVLRDTGLSSDVLQNPEGNLPYQMMGRLLESCARHTSCDHFGLLLGQRAGIGALGQVGQLLSHAPNLGTALQDLVQYQHRHPRGAVVYLSEHGQDMLFGYAVYESDIAGAVHLYDGAAAMGIGLIRRALGVSNIDGLEVMLSRHRPTNVEPYKRCFGDRLHFDSDYSGIIFPRRWMNRPVLEANALARKGLEMAIGSYRRAADLDLGSRLRRAVSVGLLTGKTSKMEMASKLNVSTRTLQRRLEELDSSFQHVLDETRFEFAKQFLANTRVNIAHIASVLGFADQSAFTRSFSRWSGTTPGEWQVMAMAGNTALRPVMASDAGRRAANSSRQSRPARTSPTAQGQPEAEHPEHE